MFWVAVTAAPVVVWAHETDQYSVPVGREYAELGPYFSDGYRQVLIQAAATLNGQIAATLRDGQPTAATERFYAPAYVASTFYHAIPLWVDWVEPIESRLLAPQQRARFPGLLTVYHPPSWIYHHWMLLLDPTKLPRLVRCGTITVNGVEIGTDKLMHFAHMGQCYVQVYYRARGEGKSVEQAMQAAVDLGTGPNPFLSEATWLGLMSTGVWSNSDLAVNYVGMLFFRNLTETVRVHGENLPPMLVREGSFWRVSARGMHDRALFSRYVSGHWNEVFNPNVYAPLMDGCVRDEIRKRCNIVTDWYRDRHLRLRRKADFLQRMEELSTYYGADYGYRGDPAELVSVVTVCPLPDELPDEDGPGDALGRTELWWAAGDGDVDALTRALTDGADVNAADIDGETPLHAAARGGHASAIARLAAAGVDVNARALYGTTPLHVAARMGHAAAVEALLAAGADANVADDFGVTPLEGAGVHGYRAVVENLMAGGAQVDAARRDGVALSERVRRAGHADLAGWLAAHEVPAP